MVLHAEVISVPVALEAILVYRYADLHSLRDCYVQVNMSIKCFLSMRIRNKFPRFFAAMVLGTVLALFLLLYLVTLLVLCCSPCS